ncbi:glycoprotein-N-acetylgalactosamine 3-beta-galactosyltransferase 1-like [Babylonia areolata]|uniref:glycoprotein-N-acetylgalactosamine 3-beta-galactosyltransferase 1-like n=1 Tax=Babylonia areolata TaxID=304850 RepID=UPI003FD43AA7
MALPRRFLVVVTLMVTCLAALLLLMSVTKLSDASYRVHRVVSSFVNALSSERDHNKSDSARSHGPDDIIEVDDEHAVRLARRVRVLVWVLTSPQTRDRAVTVNSTWGQRVSPGILLFVSSTDDPTLPTIPLNVSEGRKHLTEKTFQAFEYAYKHYFDRADFFMKVDDDTYVIMENLRYFLSHLDPDKPFFTGRHFKPLLKQGFTSGGAGYVLSRAALKRLGTRTRTPPQCEDFGIHEDVHLSACMEKLGIPILNSTDSRGGSRFHPYTPMKHVVTGLGKNYQHWDAGIVRIGPQAINEYPITFHYITPNDMRLMHFFIYRVRLYGINYKYN